MKKYVAILVSVLLLAMAIPLGAVGVSAEAPADGGWVWPVNGGVFGRGFENSHSGIDIQAGYGVPVLAAANGTVICASEATTAAEGYCGTCGRYGAGYHVTIRHANGVIGMYAHLSDVCVKFGQQVTAGQQVGAIGSTGNSTGNHLHFSLFANGAIADANLVDPLYYLTPFNNVYVTDVTETGAVIHGDFGAVGPTVVNAGIYIGTDPAHMVKITENVNTTGYYSNGTPITGLFYGTAKWWKALEPGTTYYYRMWISRYGKEYVTGVRSFTTAGGHTHAFGDWAVTTAATCATDGVQLRSCACGACEQQAIPATGHHVYEDDDDADCAVCGAVREVEIPVAPTFAVDCAEARVGEEFTVAVRTIHNSGIVSFKLKVHYDDSALELVAVEEQDFANLTYSPLTNNPFIVNWVDTIHPDNTTDGVVALLTFRVKEGAAGNTAITLSYDSEDVYDQHYDNVEFALEGGTVTVLEYVLGDINGDDRINNKDLGALYQYLNEWDVTLNASAADVNGDGRINNKDLGILQQYVNDWNVTLG